jgi:hypothetical protein
MKIERDIDKIVRPPFILPHPLSRELARQALQTGIYPIQNWDEHVFYKIEKKSMGLRSQVTFCLKTDQWFVFKIAKEEVGRTNLWFFPCMAERV